MPDLEADLFEALSRNEIDWDVLRRIQRDVHAELWDDKMLDELDEIINELIKGNILVNNDKAKTMFSSYISKWWMKGHDFALMHYGTERAKRIANEVMVTDKNGYNPNL